MVMALVSARALAMARVPSAKAGNSNTPMGPFQMTVPASFTASVYRAMVLGPMSMPMRSSGMAMVSTSSGLASAENSAAHRVSTGSSSLTPLALAFSIISLQ